jgi:hypothetical protein
MNARTQKILNTLGSAEITVFCLGLAMLVVFFGTIAQVRMGTYAAQKVFFNSFWIYGTVRGWKIPVFPGGLAVGGAWMVNLLAAFVVRFKFRKSDAGILISHSGVIVLLLGQLLTQMLAIETQMPIEVGQTRNYSESFRDTELALIRTSDPAFDEVTSIPYSSFSRRSVIPIPGTPISLAIKRFFRNAGLRMGVGGFSPLATEGLGSQIAVQEIASVSSDEETNNITASVEIRDGGRSIGTWLVSMGLGAPQSFAAGGQTYQISLRPRRHYYPFLVTLKEFRHDFYPGTDIPKNFASLVHLENPGKNESRDVLIYMNHPLRYASQTFYQASFGKGDRLSVFQVVQNPVWLTPYISCTLVTVGLAIQFLTHLLGFLRRKREA